MATSYKEYMDVHLPPERNPNGPRHDTRPKGYQMVAQHQDRFWGSNYFDDSH
jgi:hypothetical protein